MTVVKGCCAAAQAGRFATVRHGLPTGTVADVGVSDVLGRTVLRSSFVIRTSSFPLDLRSLSAGVYLVRLTADGCTAASKLIVQR